MEELEAIENKYKESDEAEERIRFELGKVIYTLKDIEGKYKLGLASSEDLSKVLTFLSTKKKELKDARVNKATLFKARKRLRVKLGIAGVTDHARVRFLERIMEMDFMDIDREILKEEFHVNTIINNTVVTVGYKTQGEKEDEDI